MTSAAADARLTATETTGELDTPQGPGRLVLNAAADPVALLVLGHGAGGGVESPDLVTLAHRLPGAGFSVLRVEQPWRTEGRKVAVAPARLDQAWVCLLEQFRARAGATLPWVIGGRSAGARVACRTAGTLGAVGVLCLAFPLHPPGRPGSSRVKELLAPAVPRLVLQGSRDPFGGPAEVIAALGDAEPAAAGVTVIGLTGADHALRVPKRPVSTRPGLSPSEVADRLVGAVTVFVRRQTGLAPAGE